MPTYQEMPMQDAPASLDTEFCFNPPNGPFDGESPSSKFQGNLDTKADEDWIIIELSEGKEYTITLMGERADDMDDRPLDTVLRVLDSKGTEILMNDDKNGSAGDLWSELEITPEAGSGTQKYHISAAAFTGNPSDQGNMGSYTITVKELVLPGTIAGDDSKPVKLVGTAAGEDLIGGSADDVLDGKGGNDTLDGKDGNDLLSGGPGADVITGGAGDNDTVSYKYSMEGVTINLLSSQANGGDAEGDTLKEDIESIEGSMHDDMLTGSDVTNYLWGLGGDDFLDGDEDDDTLTGGPGADELVGGEGSDTASYAGSAAGVTVRLHAMRAMGGDAEGDTFPELETATYFDEDGDAQTEEVPDIENLTGSGHDDILAGDSRDNVLMGGAGDDKLYGGPGGGDDEMHGGAGNDMVFGGKGDDDLTGGPGDDMLHGGPGADTYEGGMGDDLIYADKDDALNDIEGGDGSDTVSYERLEDTPYVIDLPGDIEIAVGSQDDDVINGNDEDNTIEGGEGGDEMTGGAGTNTLSYASSDDWVRVKLLNTADDDNWIDASRGHASGDSVTSQSFHNIIGSAYDDDLEGDNMGNSLMGGAGDDDIVGNGGSDTVEGGARADTMDGGNESNMNDGGTPDKPDDDTPDLDDWLSYESSDAAVMVNLARALATGGHADGDEIVTAEEDHDLDDETDEIDVSTFENVRGSGHDDDLTGDHRENMLEGGDGADDIDGGADWDTATFANAMEGVTVDLGANRGTGGEAEGDRYSDIEAFMGSGNDDTFIAGRGFDTVDGSGGQDTISYEKSKRAVTVNLLTQTTPAKDKETDPVSAWRYLAENLDDFYLDGSNDKAEDNTNTKNVRDQHETSYKTVGALLTDLTGDGAKDVKIDDGDDEEQDVVLTTSVLSAKGADGGYSVADISTLVTLYGADNEAIDLRNSYNKGDQLNGIENVIGSSYDDVITGNNVSAHTDDPETVDDESMIGNTLSGGAGDDTITGGKLNDTLDGGAGSDTLMGAKGDDTLKGGSGRLDKLIGGDGDDKLYGGAGDDNLVGDSVGDKGKFDGKKGNDIFVFSPEDGSGTDTIEDFAAANDKIDLSAFNLTADMLKELMTIRGNNTLINLSDHGGGKILVDNIDNLDAWETGTNDNVDVIDTLSEYKDLNNDGMIDGTTTPPEVDGIFIL